MKKFLLLICALLLILSACETQPLYRWDDTSDDYSYDWTDWTTDVSYEEEEEETSDSMDSEPIPFNPPEEVAVDWPEPPAKYDPKVEVIPVVEEGEYFYHYLDGKTAFIDRNHKRVPIPEEARTYYMTEQCILLANGNGNIAIMRFDGKVVTDFLYSFTESGVYAVDSYHSSNGFVCVWKKTKTSDDHEYHCFLVDIQTGKEVTDIGYCNMDFHGSFIRTYNHDTNELIGYNGKPFFDLGDKSITIYQRSDDNVIYHFPSHCDYLIDETTKTFYRQKGENDINMYWTDKLYSFEDSNNCKISVYTQEQKLLLQLNDYRSFESTYNDGDYFVILTEQDFIVVTEDEIIYKIPTENIPRDSDGYYSVYNVYFKDEKLTFDADSARIITLDLDGKILKNVDFDEENVTLDGHIKRKHGEVLLVSDTGKTLISFGNNYELYEYGQFIRARNYTLGSAFQQIYNLRGEKLLSNVYKIITSMTFDDRLLIYKTTTNCGFLYPDGKFLPLVISD